MSSPTFWDQKSETIPRELLEQLQLKLLLQSIETAKRSPVYKKQLHSIPSLKSLSDIERIPFTEKQDLRNAFPYGYVSVPLSDTVRLHSSSGTTGNPTVVFHTKEDLDKWADLVARCMYMTGARNTDVFQNTMGYGLFTGGLGFHYGAEKLGMLTIPIGPGNGKRQLWFMQQFNTSVIHILPSYALHLFSAVEEEGLDLNNDLKLRIAFIGAEPHTEELRQQIQNLWGIKAYNSYGLSEMCGPGVAFECQNQDGLHLWEDHFLMEIIDPASGKVLPIGEQGELVLTTLQRQAMPLLRYRTRDLTRIIDEPCSCGRTHRRIDRIMGRSDDMLIINGVNLFPQQIEKTILQFSGVGNNYLIEIHKEEHMDRIHVILEVQMGTFHGTLSELDQMKKSLTHALLAECGVSPHVKLVEPGTVPIVEGKAKRVVDLR